MSNKNKIIIGLASFLVLIAVGFAAKSKMNVKNNSVMEEAVVSSASENSEEANEKDKDMTKEENSNDDTTSSASKNDEDVNGDIKNNEDSNKKDALSSASSKDNSKSKISSQINSKGTTSNKNKSNAISLAKQMEL